ncbi:hypothetical protein L1281_000928 [Neisseria sp. HSC-16F19]|nr:hypothetical protein [Neisseria sp. HSC-16F19]MCP2040346.1 hypothetical protein [Neisseria sp. HSC-16F19]
MRPTRLHCLIYPLAVLLLLQLGGCYRVRSQPDFRPHIAATASAQPLPVRLHMIEADSALNLSAVSRLAPCIDRSSTPARLCTDAEAARQHNPYITRALEQALHDSFAQARLFSDTAAQAVSLKATVLSLDMQGSRLHRGDALIRYEFTRSDNGDTLFSTDIRSHARELAVSPADMGAAYDKALAQTVQTNIAELLRRLQQPQQQAPFYVR